MPLSDEKSMYEANNREIVDIENQKRGRYSDSDNDDYDDDDDDDLFGSGGRELIERKRIIGEEDVVGQYFEEVERAQANAAFWSFVVVFASIAIVVRVHNCQMIAQQ